LLRSGRYTAIIYFLKLISGDAKHCFLQKLISIKKLLINISRYLFGKKKSALSEMLKISLIILNHGRKRLSSFIIHDHMRPLNGLRDGSVDIGIAIIPENFTISRRFINTSIVSRILGKGTFWGKVISKKNGSIMDRRDEEEKEIL